MITLPHFFCEEQVAPPQAGQPGLPMIATASDEMQLLRAGVAPRMVGHGASLTHAGEEML